MMSKDFSRIFLLMLQMCYWEFQKRFKVVSMVLKGTFQGTLKLFERILRGCFKGILGFQRSFKGISMVCKAPSGLFWQVFDWNLFQLCFSNACSVYFNVISILFWGYFCLISRVFQECFMAVSKDFLTCVLRLFQQFSIIVYLP